jgi:hypothetical protein
MSDSTKAGAGDGLPNRTRAHRGPARSPRTGPPGRETRAATSTYRNEFLAIGNRSGTEKDRLGALLTDFGRVSGEIALLTLPVMLFLPFAEALAPFAPFETWLVGLATMVAVGTLIRNGVIASLPFTDAPGWARLFPTLVLLRLVYFNGTLLAAILGGGVVVSATGSIAAGLLWSLVVGGTATLLFPAAVDAWMTRRA